MACKSKGLRLLGDIERNYLKGVGPVFPSGQSGPWSGPWVGSPVSPAMVLRSLGQSGLNYQRPPKPAGAQATAGSRG